MTYLQFKSFHEYKNLGETAAVSISLSVLKNSDIL